MSNLESFKKQLTDNHVEFEAWGYPRPQDMSVYNTIVTIPYGEDEETGLILSFSIHFHDGELAHIDLETD